MVVVNEWLPNPKGSDVDFEWIEIWNNGSAPAALKGWHLTNSAGKKFYFGTELILPQEYAVLVRSTTKLTLRNSDESIALVDPTGVVADRSSFVGAAPEGKSYNRGQGGFYFAEPTPDAVNAPRAISMFSESRYDPGTPLAAPTMNTEALGITLVVALLITALTLFAIKKNENLSELLFGGDETLR